MSLPLPHLSTDEIAGQLLFVGVEGTDLDAPLRRRLERVRPGGVILFARNLRDAAQVASLLAQLRDCLEIPPLLAIDQEGGRVNRLKGIFPAIPPNLSLAGSPSAPALVEEHGSQTGLGLALLGFNLNFAPVLDLSGRDDPNGIGDRSYGADPREVVRFAAAFLRGQAARGVLGCGKHFPGLGGGGVDSHLDLPVVTRSRFELWEKDLAPYRDLKEELPLVMVGHAHYPALQGEEPRPATLSRSVVTDLLRRKIGFRGVALTDDLEMGAVDQRRGAGDLALEALEAGNDMAMFCNSWERAEEAHRALVQALETGSLARPRAEASLERILALKRRLPPPRQSPPFELRRFQEVCRRLEDLGRAVEG